MGAKIWNYAIAVLIFTATVLIVLTKVTSAALCYECEYWPINGTDQSCLSPTEMAEDDSDSINIVDCEHSCFVSNHSDGDGASVRVSRGCFENEYCPTMCMIHPSYNWEECTYCCDDDLCNDMPPEEPFEDSTWCYDCGSYESDCENPSPQTTLRTTCDTMCEMNVYISVETTVRRGCAISEEDCNDCDDRDDCNFCCVGSYCNDAPPDVIARKTNHTQDCYSCYYSPNSFEVLDSVACGTNFNPDGHGVQITQCAGVCKKVISGSSVERSCVHEKKDCVPSCPWFASGPCTYCCTGDRCNSGLSMTSSFVIVPIAITALSIITIVQR